MAILIHVVKIQHRLCWWKLVCTDQWWSLYPLGFKLEMSLKCKYNLTSKWNKISVILLYLFTTWQQHCTTTTHNKILINPYGQQTFFSITTVLHHTNLYFYDRNLRTPQLALNSLCVDVTKENLQAVRNGRAANGLRYCWHRAWRILASLATSRYLACNQHPHLFVSSVKWCWGKHIEVPTRRIVCRVCPGQWLKGQQGNCPEQCFESCPTPWPPAQSWSVSDHCHASSASTHQSIQLLQTCIINIVFLFQRRSLKRPLQYRTLTICSKKNIFCGAEGINQWTWEWMSLCTTLLRRSLFPTTNAGG